MIAAVADGVGGHLGGREAAELSVRRFIQDFYSVPETLGPRRAAARVLEATNSWIHAQGHLEVRQVSRLLSHLHRTPSENERSLVGRGIR